MRRYTCPRELLPTVESALAAEGYLVEHFQREVGGGSITILTHAGTAVALQDRADRDEATILVRGDPPQGSIAVLEELPRLLPTPLGYRT